MSSETTETPETYTPPPHGWTCFFCGETFTTPGAAADHFGDGQFGFSQPGCLVDYAVQVEEGCKPERGRGLLMALRKEEAENMRLRRKAEEHDHALGSAQTLHSNERRKIGELIHPGRTVEELVELFHATTPEHGGLVLYCQLWPCVWITHQHRFTQTKEDVHPELAKNCIVCGRQEGHDIHV